MTDVDVYRSQTHHLMNMGQSRSQPGHPAGFHIQWFEELRNPESPAGAESCLHPHENRDTLHADLGLLKCHFLSLRCDGVRCSVSGEVGGVGDTEGWRLAQCYPTSYLPEKQI